jgi:valyl-tRNA synthetase
VRQAAQRPRHQSQSRRTLRPLRSRRLVYFDEPDTIVPAGTKCPHCGATKFEKETDIFDVWLESGASYLALIADEPDYPWPSDLYLEGGDQYRGWFQSSLLCAMGTRATPPYRGVVTPGWTLDEKGQAMSKSRGNDVDPVDIASRLGGEIVRLWTASVDFREDVVGSEALMQRLGDNYKKIRNTFRYILSNFYDFDPLNHAVPFEEMEDLDQYILRQTCALPSDVRNGYDDFAFHRIYHRVNHFCMVDLSAFYFDVLKDRLYIIRAQFQISPLGPDRGLAHRRSAGPPAGSHHDLHLRRNLATSAADRWTVKKACIWRNFPRPLTCWETLPFRWRIRNSSRIGVRCSACGSR